MQPSLPTNRSPSWPEVLSHVQEAVQEAEAAAAQRLQLASAAPPPPLSQTRQPTWHQSQQRLQECLDGLEACAARAAQGAEQTEVIISAGADVIGRWLAQWQTIAQKLAKGAAGTVR